MEENVEELKEALVDLYLKVKVRSSDDIENYNSDQNRKEKQELEGTKGLSLIENIRDNVEMLLNIKSEESENDTEGERSLAYPDFFSRASSILSAKNTMREGNDYEKIIQKLEADVRGYIRSEHQLKLYCESLVEKLDCK